ncbi:hypothetical protein LZ32DRAFT_345686 [Colletotrichum eremochloae]|nr:hypothetical protein LZ32DRAFT_345686 [Colletotrichum eremochloae]
MSHLPLFLFSHTVNNPSDVLKSSSKLGTIGSPSIPSHKSSCKSSISSGSSRDNDSACSTQRYHALTKGRGADTQSEACRVKIDTHRDILVSFFICPNGPVWCLIKPPSSASSSSFPRLQHDPGPPRLPPPPISRFLAAAAWHPSPLFVLHFPPPTPSFCSLDWRYPKSRHNTRDITLNVS